MSKGWRIAAIVTMVAILGVATVGAVAYAQESTIGLSSVLDLGQRVKEAVAKALGITVEKYDETVTAAQKQVLDEAVASGELTQEQADRMQKRLSEPDGFGGRGMGHMGIGGQSVLLTVTAEKLGLTEQELMTELQGGKSIADVAKEKGVDTQVISDAYLAQIETDLDAQVADGSLTQEEADAKLAEKTEALSDRLTQTWSMPDGHSGRGRHGGQPDTATSTTLDGQ